MMPLVLLCFAVLAGQPRVTLYASPQDPSGVPSTSVDRIKERLNNSPARPLTPAVPEQLRPTFKSTTERHPFVLTLDEDLHKTFALTDFQRRYAEYSARCCGVDLGAVVKQIDKAFDERRVRKTREQIARELADLEAARAAAAAVK
jgi:hypothetical protein